MTLSAGTRVGPYEILAPLKRAQELEPLTPLFFADRGWQLWWGGRNDEALAEARKSLDLDPKFAYGRAVVGYGLAKKGKNEAFRWLDECFRKRSSFLPWLDQNPAYAPLRRIRASRTSFDG